MTTIDTFPELGTVHVAIVELGKRRSLDRGNISEEDTHFLSAAFLRLAQADLDTARKAVAERKLSWYGHHSLNLDVGGDDGVVWTSGESVDITAEETRLVGWATVNDLHNKIIETLSPMGSRLISVEWLTTEKALGQEPVILEHVMIKFTEENMIASFTWERNHVTPARMLKAA